MASFTIQLPAGTNVKKCINLPTTGSWVGLVVVSLSTTVTDATIANWYTIWPDAHTIGTHYYRRLGGTQAGNWVNWTLKADSRIYRGLLAKETLTTIKYTSTNDISLCVETTRSVKVNAHPDRTGIAGDPSRQASIDWNGTITLGTTPPF